MSHYIHILTHGKVDKDFYTKHLDELRKHNVNMLKISFTFATVITLILFALTFFLDLLQNMKVFYGIFALWFTFWEIMTFTFLSKHHNYAKFFDAMMAGGALVLTAFAGTMYSPDMCTVTYFIFLIFIPGLYVNKPTCCITTSVLSGIIFNIMIRYYKIDPYIIYVDTVNTIFAVIVGIAFNLYIINMQLQNIQSSAHLKEQSNLDELTSMPNRRCFNHYINNYFNDCQNCEISVIMMDIDYFKKYNDTYGHLKGDECLSLVGECLMQTAQKYNIFAARYGGEEFVAIDTQSNSDKVKYIAESFVNAIQALNIPNDHSSFQYITLSAGYASRSGSNAQNYMQLINCADSALYEAKSCGRNCCRGYFENQSLTRNS